MAVSSGWRSQGCSGSGWLAPVGWRRRRRGEGPGRRTEQLLEGDLEGAVRAVDDGQQRIRRGLAPLGGDVALRVDGARTALEDDLAATDLRRHAVPVGVGLAIGEQDRRAQRVPVPALDEKTDDAGPLRLPGGIERGRRGRWLHHARTAVSPV